MHIHWLHCFIEIVKNKSLSKASEQLNLSQPALSKQIKNLEEYYNVKLFIRSTSGMELTEEGAILYNKLPPILAELSSIHQVFESRRELKTIAIATLPSIAAYFLPLSILYLEKNGTKTRVDALPHSAQIMKDLMEEKANIGIVDKSSSIPKHFWQRDLFSEPYHAIFPQGHRFEKQISVSIHDMKDELFVFFPPSCDVRQSIEKACMEVNLTPKVSVEAQFGESILGLVSAGAGITILPEISAKHIAQHALFSRPLLDLHVQRTITLVARNEQLGKRIYSIIKKQ